MSNIVAAGVEYLGTFSPYRPDPWPEQAPVGAQFLRNEDGVDLRDKLELADLSDPLAVPLTGDHFIGIVPGGRVGCSINDTDRLQYGHPARVAFHPTSPEGPVRSYRVSGLPDRGLAGGYNLWTFDPETGALTPMAVIDVIAKADVWRRATDAEAAVIDAQLNAQSVRLRRLWQDAQDIRSTDELYPLIFDGFVAAFGEARAVELLAPSIP